MSRKPSVPGSGRATSATSGDGVPQQDQFLKVVDLELAIQEFQAHLDLKPVEESVGLAQAAGRITARDCRAEINVPGFDRSNFDGYAVRASDIRGASEHRPIRLKRLSQQIAAGDGVAQIRVEPHTAISIATGGALPRGADAVVMVEDTVCHSDEIEFRRAVPPAAGVTFAGSDISIGQIVVYAGSILTSRETAALAAIGFERVAVWRRPRVAIISTGNELVAPGAVLKAGQIFDSNSRMLADAVREVGGQPHELGIVSDDADELRASMADALAHHELVLLSGGTSKGEGDICFRIVRELQRPGLLVHGVAIKPGKPVCLAAQDSVPVAVLPGFPTSAIFTFHHFVAPIIRKLAGMPTATMDTVDARLSRQVNSSIGRTEFCLVQLVNPSYSASNSSQPHPPQTFTAVPTGHGSGSVVAFSQADGFIAIGKHEEIVPEGSGVHVHMLNDSLQVSDLVIVGSHCQGVELLASALQAEGVRCKCVFAGSTQGLRILRRGEADLCGIHLLDPASNKYNTPFMQPAEQIVFGYRRTQGLFINPDVWDRMNLTASQSVPELVRELCERQCRMINRNQGSGTRILIDQLLAACALANDAIAGYAFAATNHHAVVAAVADGRADWGIAIESANPGTVQVPFVPWVEEQFDLLAGSSALRTPHLTQQVSSVLHSDALLQKLRDRRLQPTHASWPT